MMFPSDIMLNKIIMITGFLASVLHLQSKEEHTRDVIAAVLMAEGRSEGISGMRAIAEVIRNRGNDPIKVVTAYRQFSCLNGRSTTSLILAMKLQKGWYQARAIATELRTRPEQFGNTVKGATHYETVGHTPFWAMGLKLVATVRKLNFFICR